MTTASSSLIPSSSSSSAAKNTSPGRLDGATSLLDKKLRPRGEGNAGGSRDRTISLGNRQREDRDDAVHGGSVGEEDSDGGSDEDALTTASVECFLFIIFTSSRFA